MSTQLPAWPGVDIPANSRQGQTMWTLRASVSISKLKFITQQLEKDWKSMDKYMVSTAVSQQEGPGHQLAFSVCS